VTPGQRSLLWPDEREPCDRCLGTGRVPDRDSPTGDRTCGLCNGSGWTTDIHASEIPF
jgi:DnaJ-class molecular chaperone